MATVKLSLMTGPQSEKLYVRDGTSSDTPARAQVDILRDKTAVSNAAISLVSLRIHNENKNQTKTLVLYPVIRGITVACFIDAYCEISKWPFTAIIRHQILMIFKMFTYTQHRE